MDDLKFYLLYFKYGLYDVWAMYMKILLRNLPI